jgi:hypothetical protein
VTTVAELESVPIEFPPWVNSAAIVRPLLNPAITEERWSPGGAELRRRATRWSPLHFALVYLMDYFRDQRTGVVSFADGHLDMFTRVADWADGQGCHCFACVAARKFGKSTTTTFAGPAWALCHRHHTFFALFSNTVDLAVVNHTRRLVDLFDASNRASELLLRDYPHMVPLKGGGPKRTVFRGGATIAAGGVMDKTLGMVERNERPTLIGADDMLPGKAMTNRENVEKVKARLTTDIWPMNDEADKFVSGTMFDRGDFADDIVRIATGERPRSDDRGRWLTSRGFECLYYRPIWPQRGWPTAAMVQLREQSPVNYALQYEPDLLGEVEQDTYFTDELFAARRFPVAGMRPIARAIFTDHAVTRRAGADKTAIAVLSFDGRRVFVEHAESDRYDMRQVAARIYQLAADLADQGMAAATVLGWEENQGGEALADTFADAYGLPAGLKLRPFGVGANKAARIKALHSAYAEHKVFHPVELPAFEAQAVAWRPGASGPGVDDMLDAVSAGVRFFLRGDPGDKYMLKPGRH